MNKNNVLIIAAIIAAVLVAGSILLAMNKNKPEPQDQTIMNDSDKMMMEDKMHNDSDAMTDDQMMKDEMQKESMDKDAMMQKPGSYKNYSAATVEAEQAAGNKVVLFFHAPWCPFCKTADSAFNSRSSEIPSGVTLLKTDYDSNTELKQKYGVTYQHTFVQIDGNENQVSKWNGGDIDNLKKYLK